MGNFEKLSVLVIVVIIVMILVVALYTWTGEPDATGTGDAAVAADTPLNTQPPASLPSRPPPPAVPESVFPQAPPVAPPPGVDVPSTPPSTPPAPPTPPPAPAENVVAAHEYVVQSGDTLGDISRKRYGSQRYVDEILKANPGVRPERLRVKAVLHLPEVTLAAGARLDSGSREGSSSLGSGSGVSPKAGSTYTVRKGDTLPGIAKSAWGTIDRWHELLSTNYEVIDNPDRLSAGTRLRIPR